MGDGSSNNDRVSSEMSASQYFSLTVFKLIVGPKESSVSNFSVRSVTKTWDRLVLFTFSDGILEMAEVEGLVEGWVMLHVEAARTGNTF